MPFKIKLEMDDTARSYRAHFLGYEHYNLCGTDENLGPVVVSVKTYSDLEGSRSSKKGGDDDEDEGVQVRSRTTFGRVVEDWCKCGSVSNWRFFFDEQGGGGENHTRVILRLNTGTVHKLIPESALVAAR